jgi:predicted TIM-barrel fold metal-dependent hydrolase
MAFLEVSAQWVPYVYRDLTKRFRMEGREFSGATLLSDSRIYVGVENNDDLPYIIDNAGDDNLVIGSDYGHADSATELMALERFSADSRLAPMTVEKILDHNPRALYGI